MGYPAKKLFALIILIYVCAGSVFAGGGKAATDPIKGILQIGRHDLQERMLTDYLKTYFQNIPAVNIPACSKKVNDILAGYNIADKLAYRYFIGSLCQVQLNNWEQAENDIVQAICEENDKPDQFMLFTFFSYWGMIRATRGNSIGAIYSYWRAKQEAMLLGDYYSQAVLDISMADLYCKSSAYSQSLFYLNNSRFIIADHKLDERALLTLIYYNKAEIFFRMNKPDSLRVYDLKLKSPDNVTYKIQTYRLRADYYLQLLAHNYRSAIQLIRSMLGGNKLYLYSALDKQHLADAYYMNGQTDSAKLVINQLLAAPLESNNPEIKLNLYLMLAAIAKKNNDATAAAYNTNLALMQSHDYITRLNQINNMSAQMAMDEMENSYTQKTEGYKTERLIMLFVLVIAALTAGMIFIFYRSLKREQHYEKLLHSAEKYELAFINSHGVRKHLCNILGIMNIIRLSDKKEHEFLKTQEALYYSAEQLDRSIRNIAEKLND